MDFDKLVSPQARQIGALVDDAQLELARLRLRQLDEAIAVSVHIETRDRVEDFAAALHQRGRSMSTIWAMLAVDAGRRLFGTPASVPGVN